MTLLGTRHLFSSLIQHDAAHGRADAPPLRDHLIDDWGKRDEQAMSLGLKQDSH